MERYDAIVIGAGPGGISAAITLTIRNKAVLVIGNEEISSKVSKSHEINNYPGLPAISGQELAGRLLDHARSLGITIDQRQVNAVYDMGGFFNLQLTDNTILEASSVIIATGVNFGKPYKGEKEFLGRGVSYCATCDAPLYKGRPVVIIGASKKEEAEADFMAEISSEVVYIPLYKEPVEVCDRVKVIYGKPLEIKGGLKANTLVLQQEAGEVELKSDCFFILRDSVSPDTLVPGLKLDGNHIEVNRRMETNIKGCFACGDIVGTPYQYVKAAGEGNIAAISCVDYLSKR